MNLNKTTAPTAVKIKAGDKVVRRTNKFLSVNTEYTVEKVHGNGMLVLEGFMANVRPDSVTLVKK